jgi:hypothetical protein
LVSTISDPQPAAIHVSRPGFRAAHPWLVRWLGALTLLVSLALIFGATALWHMFSPAANGSNGHGTAAPGQSEDIREHPWGKLACVPIVISPPLEFVPEIAPPMASEGVWRVPDISTARLTDYFTSLALPEDVRSQLMAMAQLDPTINGVALRPPREFVLKLAAEDRAKLYVGLAQFPQNVDQVNAFRFHGTTLDEWFAHARLAPQTRRLVDPLVYRHNGYLFFADLRSVEPDLASHAERLLLIKALSREVTFLVKLVVEEGADVESLLSYWSRGGRAKDIRPILESLARVPGGERIDVIHLIPRFARARIYTYPQPPEKQPALNRDCHWTSLNFFSAEPDDRFCQDAEVVRALDQDYYRIYGNFQLGDLVVFFSGDRAIHSAVYIAEDILFTKNGNISSRPWMFCKLDDVRNYYPMAKPPEVRYYRRKDV